MSAAQLFVSLQVLVCFSLGGQTPGFQAEHTHVSEHKSIGVVADPPPPPLLPPLSATIACCVAIVNIENAGVS